jgi:hypothetical protein
LDNLDAMTEFCIERLLAGSEGWRGVVRDIAARWPNVPPMEMVLALVSAAEAIAGLFGPAGPAREAATHAWRLAALLALDVYAMERSGHAHARASDCLDYWRSKDRYFLDL